jgi:hypothetical protein
VGHGGSGWILDYWSIWWWWVLGFVYCQKKKKNNNNKIINKNITPN